MITLKISELKLGDVVEVFEGPFGTGVVRQIKDGSVTIFRPYAITSDFSYTGGVIPYTGTEEINFGVGDRATFKVYSRKEVK